MSTVGCWAINATLGRRRRWHWVSVLGAPLTYQTATCGQPAPADGWEVGPDGWRPPEGLRCRRCVVYRADW